MTTLSKWRINYPDGELTMDNLTHCPFELFEEWIQKAFNDGVIEPNAMTLSTINEDIPDSRMVLLKDFNTNGFVFYTNYLSNKGNQIAKNNNAALCFWWPNCHRQVRIQGQIFKLGTLKSDNYFASRDRDTQIGAWASKQSEKLDSYQQLLTQFEQTKNEFNDKNVSRPQHWGGYILNPTSFEFWQGRHSRLHDRILFNKNSDIWLTSRLSP
jgi:pyridoxamine 5'-phosphate oxidase